MKKLTLRLESLQVQSFETLRAQTGARGTVRGNLLPDENAAAFTDGPSCWWVDCITFSCICGNSEKAACNTTHPQIDQPL